MDRPVTLTFCRDCAPLAPADRAALEGALDGAGTVALAEGPCLGPCRAAVMALQQPGGASYVFAGLEVARDAQDIAATVRAVRAAPGGWIVDARPCGRLRHLLAVRLPAAEAPGPEGPEG